MELYVDKMLIQGSCRITRNRRQTSLQGEEWCQLPASISRRFDTLRYNLRRMSQMKTASAMVRDYENPVTRIYCFGYDGNSAHRWLTETQQPQGDRRIRVDFRRRTIC
jgi:hypothetical protein